MKKLLLLVLISLRVFDCCAQQSTPVKSNTTFNTQGDQERYWAKQFFQSHYEPQHNDKYQGIISNDGEGNFRYGAETISVSKNDTLLNLALTKGLIYPGLFLDFAFLKSKKVRLGDLEELPELSNSIGIKRFRFLEWGNMANPTVYLIELTNKKADSNTSRLDFIKEAELTFFAQGWIQL